MHLSIKKWIFLILGIALAVLFFALPPFSGLSAQGMQVLGIFAMAISWWIGDVFQDYITAFWMMTIMVATGSVPLETAFSAFSGSVVWIVIPVLLIAAALSKSGLLLRCVLAVLSKFKRGYKSQVLGILLAGNLTNALIPSATAKVAIAAPIIRMCSETMDYKQGSKETVGLFSAMWMGFGANGPLFITGTAMCFVMLGALPEAYQGGFTFLRWVGLALPWGIVLFLLSYFSICLFYAPKGQSLSSAEFIESKRAGLPKMSRDEKISAAVLLVCILLWITENVHGIPAAVVALAGMCVMFSTGVIARGDLRGGLAWDSVIFIGACCGLGTVFSKTGITQWVGDSFGSYIEPLFSNVYLLIIVLVTLVALLRFVFVSQTATISVVTIASTPFAIAAGIHPFIPGFIVLVTANIVCAPYSNSIFMAAVAASDNLVNFSGVKKMSLVYYFACIFGLICCVPMWKLLGML